MIYSSVMVLNVGNYSCQAKSVSTSCQANIVFLYTTNICLLEVHCFLKVEMKCLQTRLYETKKSLGAPVFGLRVRVSIPFTVSLIFQMSPWVASQEFATLGDSWNVSHARQMLVPSLAWSQSGNNKTGKGVFKLSVTQPPLLIMFTKSLIIWSYLTVIH